MTKPILIDLPHNLGAEEAKSRMRGGIGKLEDHLPGRAEVESSWSGDRMNLKVRAMGQEVSGHIDVEDRKVRLELMLPPFLAMLGSHIEGLLRKGGTDLLEDKTKK
jgi:hypothetical protein